MADAEKKEMNANDLQREQVERLIETTADLQKQVLRKFANSAIEEMRHHFRVAMQKNELLKDENADLKAKLARAQAAVRWADTVVQYCEWDTEFAQAIREAKEEQ